VPSIACGKMEDELCVPHRGRHDRRPPSRSPSGASPPAPSAQAREETAGEGKATAAVGSPVGEGLPGAAGLGGRVDLEEGRRGQIGERRRSGGRVSVGSGVALEGRRGAARACAQGEGSPGRRPPSRSPTLASSQADSARA
jgi:hypothetical protein